MIPHAMAMRKWNFTEEGSSVSVLGRSSSIAAPSGMDQRATLIGRWSDRSLASKPRYDVILHAP